MRKGSFRTWIIDTKTIRRAGAVLAVFAGIFLMTFLMTFLYRCLNLNFSDRFYRNVLAEELHMPAEKSESGAWVKRILGFSPSHPESVLGDFSAALSEEYVAEKTQAPTPPPEATAPPTQTPIPQPSAPTEEKLAAGGLKLANRTKFSVDPTALAAEALSFPTDSAGGVQVLILHTHTTESYASEQSIHGDSDRNLDETKNVTAVGECIAEVLRSYGISVVHDTTVHDYPSYNGAYTRSLATARGNLEQYPSIKVILDVHRDGITKEDGTKVKVVSEVRGEKVAQCMFVIGSNAILTHEHWRENLKLACKIQAEAETRYPGLMRPILLREERFNQQISTGSVILEVGSNGNTLEEAQKGAQYAAEALAAVLKHG